MKYLELYKKWMETGYIEDSKSPKRTGEGGLCNTVIGNKMEIFNPADPADANYRVYWGYGDQEDTNFRNLCYEFTPLRQTIVLLLAAMNNEL